MSVCIEFKDVSYAYPLTKKAAVKHLNCKVENAMEWLDLMLAEKLHSAIL